jgi:hypothetical protein
MPAGAEEGAPRETLDGDRQAYHLSVHWLAERLLCCRAMSSQAMSSSTARAPTSCTTPATFSGSCCQIRLCCQATPMHVVQHLALQHLALKRQAPAGAQRSLSTKAGQHTGQLSYGNSLTCRSSRKGLDELHQAAVFLCAPAPLARAAREPSQQAVLVAAALR